MVISARHVKGVTNKCVFEEPCSHHGRTGIDDLVRGICDGVCVLVKIVLWSLPSDKTLNSGSESYAMLTV